MGIWSQFHYGSIKTIPNYFNIEPSNKSQFHYGSIKTYFDDEWKVKISLSQFHYGSIKTKYGITESQVEMSLNSTMVRLKQSQIDLIRNQFGLSQFHYGSIKTVRSQCKKVKLWIDSIPLWFD